MDALHAAVFQEADSSYVLAACTQKLRSPDPVVRSTAASLLTSFIQMRKYAEAGTRGLLATASEDYPDMAPQLAEAVELLNQFGL